MKKGVIIKQRVVIARNPDKYRDDEAICLLNLKGLLLPLLLDRNDVNRLIIITFLLFLSVILSAQKTSISINMENVKLSEVLIEIKEQSGKSILFNNKLVDKYQNQSIKIKKASLIEVLDEIIKDKDLQFRIVDDVIIIEPKEVEDKPVNIDKKLTQTIKGKIVDKESQIALPGANVIILGNSPILGSVTDTDGNYKIENVLIGRYNIHVTYVGYDPVTIPEILVGSAKEVVIHVGLKESLTSIEEIVVSVRKDRPLNSMASISARSFSVEETRRYAGGLDDPARMASSFAGVTMGFFGDNAIIIRGNSPKGVLWKLEGVEIPSPNHFAGANTLGGGVVTVFSSQVMTNSDFYTGAFPAEFNNALSGVFDMKLRNGNNEKREHTFQVGVLGIDFASEGPFKKNEKSSYLFNYRYSTAGLLANLNVIPIGNQLSKYQDLSFKLNFPTNNAGTFSLWGIGGIDGSQKSELDSSEWEVEWDRMKQNWKLYIGSTGFSHKYILGEKAYMNSTILLSKVLNTIEHDRADSLLVLRPDLFIKDNSGRITLSSFINYKINAKNTFKTGMNAHSLLYNLEMSGTLNSIPSTYQNIVDENGSSYFLEYYIQLKHYISNTLFLLPGISTNYFALNNNVSIDPRLSLSWNFNPNHSISIGFGKHSQKEDLKIYFIQENDGINATYPNKDLKLSKALHFIAGYDWKINENTRIKVEPYYQYLYDIPGKPASSYSLINFKQDWSFRDSLANNSIGNNKGIDITVEQFFHNNYYYLITTSLFDSKYKGDDGIWRNTRYDKAYVINLLAGKEFFLKNNKIFGLNAKMNFTGGERISPILEDLSKQFEEVIYDEAKSFAEQLPPIQHLDVTVTYRKSKTNYSSIWAFQVKNILGEPYGGYEYNYETKKVELNNTIIVLPILSYKIEF
ncbi:carboxypeptidase-like regulatory domain-containing protein [Bacteroidota bacterium]